VITTLKNGLTVTSLKNGLVISEDKTGFESFNHLTSKMDKGSYTKFSALPDIFYKELLDDDRTLLNTIDDDSLSDILERTKTRL
tara:strand:- start:1480 stop:1731 length:252 start_codon:yes stop_codon:yes gene_type:complete